MARFWRAAHFPRSQGWPPTLITPRLSFCATSFARSPIQSKFCTGVYADSRRLSRRQPRKRAPGGGDARTRDHSIRALEGSQDILDRAHPRCGPYAAGSAVPRHVANTTGRELFAARCIARNSATYSASSHRRRRNTRDLKARTGVFAFSGNDRFRA